LDKIIKKMEENKTEDYSPYCPVCSGCGEDGCCPATMCEQSPEGDYCQTYLKELKFGYIMYHEILKMIDGDEKYEEKVNEVFDKTWDIIFSKNENNQTEEEK
jgi:hypothetical protein